jgi:hypothetical protein
MFERVKLQSTTRRECLSRPPGVAKRCSQLARHDCATPRGTEHGARGTAGSRGARPRHCAARVSARRDAARSVGEELCNRCGDNQHESGDGGRDQVGGIERIHVSIPAGSGAADIRRTAQSGHPCEVSGAMLRGAAESPAVSHHSGNPRVVSCGRLEPGLSGHNSSLAAIGGNLLLRARQSDTLPRIGRTGGPDQRPERHFAANRAHGRAGPAPRATESRESGSREGRTSTRATLCRESTKRQDGPRYNSGR